MSVTSIPALLRDGAFAAHVAEPESKPRAANLF